MICGQPSSRVDERDTTFARMARRRGTPAYVDYYGRHPERQAQDDRLRALPELLRPGGAHFDASVCGEADGWFRRIDDIAADRGTVERLAARLAESPDPGGCLQSIAAEQGAVASGSCRQRRCEDGGARIVSEALAGNAGRREPCGGRAMNVPTLMKKPGACLPVAMSLAALQVLALQARAALAPVYDFQL